MFSPLKRMLCAWLFVLGTSAALTVSGTVTAPAVPPGAVDLQTDWDVYQRPSGTTDSPLGFHVHITTQGPDKTNTFVEFTGRAHTSTYGGEISGGQIRGRAITFTIDWYNGKTGLYQGTWFDDGYLRGHTQEQGASHTAEWWTRYNDWTLS
ncbi:MAG: hypothetical protein JWN03_7179 [Nocardia sp.]|uniref:hypothetical protein n=1 Tax=Nocardia sp. TaxID=1821 RepID=UPI00260AB2D6|nr:hypothetical protein [Nocardia sp.]MCU1646904.1 hypothetical protein [Nocardia sp.]